jgi:hypothetical protein
LLLCEYGETEQFDEVSAAGTMRSHENLNSFFFNTYSGIMITHTHTKSTGIFKLPVFFVEAMDPYYIYLLGGFTYVPYKYIYIDTHIVVSCGWLDYSPTHQMFPISFHPQKVSLLFHHKIDWS